MKLSQGVEWGLHCVVLLAQDPDGAPVSRRTLAQQFALPETYLAKHLQALVRSGVLQATSGPKGGFRLARPPEEITALDVLEAIEGSASPFVCQEIRQRGTGGVPPEECRLPCTVSSVMAAAHEAWRASLRGVTVAEIRERLPKNVRERDVRATAPG
ncbi:Rrf2 family transcriptional regulator [Wenjunlia vitaminophila]|uniref:Rrf2 family transcriptional regulator n=1 Tax=Wenjunlia vitaminophila TaxID=76728 RepID=A0A0T6LQ02_WENVI|nr:Rrf2 family transcriptional regulator [Wenjunlia vitaminophila]KRV48186.1 Rrf2 family transcriptional regulator [Wenjunlia vitaminophila]